MFKKKSTESVLKEIYEAYPDAFADGQRLSGLFADFSGGQLRAQKNQLDIFLKCGGNTRILALRDKAPRIQQREYHRLVGEMMDAYSMQQERALEISSIFWKTALGTQAPAMGGQEKKEKPAKKPSEKQPRAQRIKGLLRLFGKMSGFAWLMFVVGAYGVIACTIWSVQVMITAGFAGANWIFYLLDGIYLLDLALRLFWMPLSNVFWMPLSDVEIFDMLSEVLSRRALMVLKFLFGDLFNVFVPVWIIGMLIGLICPFPVILEGIMEEMVESLPTLDLAATGVCACWWYNIVWVVRLWKSVKKDVPMWQ